MIFSKRLILAIGILVLDAIFFFLPLTALFLAYILLVNPTWFRQFLENSVEEGQ